MRLKKIIKSEIFVNIMFLIGGTIAGVLFSKVLKYLLCLLQ